MNITQASSSSSPSGALTAFLRGVERRGAVLAELQCGRAVQGDAALVETLRAFRTGAVRIPFSDWQRRFWAMLLASPLLRGPRGVTLKDGPLAFLAGLGAGPRAALLLRLVAGLEEEDAAAVLGIARKTYRLALKQALPRDGEGNVDAELWRAMGEAAQEEIRALSPERLATLAAQAAEPAPGPDVAMRCGWVWPMTLLVVLLTALALAATWWPPGVDVPVGDVTDRVLVQPLPDAGQAAARYDDALALASHRDLEWLLARHAGEVPPDDPAFDAWLVTALQAPVHDAQIASAP